MRGHALPIPAVVLALVALLALSGTPAIAQLEYDQPPVPPPGEEPPSDAFHRLEQAGDAEAHPGSEYVIVYDKSTNRVMHSGVTYVDLYTIYKVLTPKGAVDLASLRWNFDPQSSRVKVVEVNILRDGEKIPVNVKNVLTLPAPQSAIYWGNKIKLLQLPRLQVGDGIEVVAMRKGYNYALLAQEEGTASASDPMEEGGFAEPGDTVYTPPMPENYFDIVLFQADVPLLEKRYILTLPRNMQLVSRVYNGALYSSTDYSADSTVYAWWTFEQPARPNEARQPGASDYMPKVVMTTANTWEAKSRWFYQVNKDQFNVTPEMEQKVEEILDEYGVSRGSDMEKAKAINHWVAQNIRYSGQTMGEGEGFTLHSGETVFKYRSGVCKDIAAMSITLLRAAGLKTYPAMTMAGSTIEDIPADQFNHCVVAWEREPDSYVMLDPTWVPYNNDIWSKLETEQEYVIGTPEGVDLMEIRYSPPEESPLRIRNDAELDENGTLSGTVRLEGSGALDSRMRRLVYQHEYGDLPATIASIFANASDRVQIQSTSHRAANDFSGDMWIEVEYTLPEYALNVGEGFEFTSPMVSAVRNHGYLFRAGSADWEEERKTDVFLYYTQLLDVRDEIRLPSGYELVHAPEVEPVDATYAAFRGSADQKRRTLTLTTTTEVRRRQIPPEGFGGFRRAIEALDEWATTPLRIAQGGA